MPSYSIGEALSMMLEKRKWTPKVQELRMRQEWEQIVGKTVAKYTKNINLRDGKLSIQTDVGPLKSELIYGKAELIKKINTYFGSAVVKDVLVK